MEATSKDTKEISKPGTPASVNKISYSKPSYQEKYEKSNSVGSKKESRGQVTCHRCAKKGHSPDECYFKEQKCRKCGHVGHIQRACHSQKPNRFKPRKFKKSKSFKHLAADSSEMGSDSDFGIYSLGNDSQDDAIKIPLNIGSTGAQVSVVAEKVYQEKFKDHTLKSTRVRLHTYSQEEICPLGFITVNVSYEGQEISDLKLYIVPGEGPSLFGREWLRKIQLNWHKITADVKNIHMLKKDTDAKLEKILNEHSDVFKPDIGKMKDFKAKLYVEEGAQPKFCKARPVPYALQSKIETELDRLLDAGVIVPVEHSEWATPIVPVPKENTVRICGDYKVTVNPVLKIDPYPVPRIEDLFAKVSHGKYFTKIDLSSAYLQREVEEDSRKYLVINTHKGLLTYHRLPFGIASAPGIFQRAMEQILNIPGVQIYLDDLLITGSSNEEHLSNVDKVLSKLSEYGLRIKRNKFFKSSVTYLGHVIDA